MRGQGDWLPKTIIDHGVSIVPELARIGFDFEVRERVARIWGYFPRSYHGFPPADKSKEYSHA